MLGNAQNELDGLSDKDKQVAENLASLIKNGGFDARSYMGNKFREEMKDGSERSNAYLSMSARSQEAKDFRMDWLKRQYDTAVNKKRFTKSWTRVDKTKGQYRTFGALVVDLGGWKYEPAVKGASVAVSKCIAMGEPWIRRHPQTDMMEYLVLKMEWEETYEKCWSEFREEFMASSVGNGGGGATAPLLVQPRMQFFTP